VNREGEFAKQGGFWGVRRLGGEHSGQAPESEGHGHGVVLVSQGSEQPFHPGQTPPGRADDAQRGFSILGAGVDLFQEQTFETAAIAGSGIVNSASGTAQGLAGLRQLSGPGQFQSNGLARQAARSAADSRRSAKSPPLQQSVQERQSFSVGEDIYFSSFNKNV